MVNFLKWRMTHQSDYFLKCSIAKTKVFFSSHLLFFFTIGLLFSCGENNTSPTPTPALTSSTYSIQAKLGTKILEDTAAVELDPNGTDKLVAEFKTLEGTTEKTTGVTYSIEPNTPDLSLIDGITISNVENSGVYRLTLTLASFTATVALDYTLTSTIGTGASAITKTKNFKIKGKEIRYSSDYPNNLNVVYFIPSDKYPLENYQRRLSGIMIHTQAWIKKEMNRNGFGDKTFGLLVDEANQNNVKIIVVKGSKNADYYPYTGGGAKAHLEIEEYFKQNPSEKASKHTVVFMPSIAGDNGWNAGGVPFYGTGKWCYVLDYKYFDMKIWRNGTREGSKSWIGGTIHEIGHALNLPHNQHKVSDGWTSMMSWGNHEYNNTPDNVHLTKASAVILNNTQVLNNNQEIDYYSKKPLLSIKSMRIYADETNLYLNSKFTTSIPVNAVNVYNDPKKSDGDLDYNAITWATTNIIENNAVSFVMPLADIDQDYKAFPFDLRIRFCHINGNFSYESFKYEYKNGKPDIDVNIIDIDEVDKSGWTIHEVSSEEDNFSAINGHAKHAIDNDSFTYWHSRWQASKPNYPHFIAINLNKSQLINGFTFLHRIDKTNGRAKLIKIETSNDGTSYNNIGEFTLNDKTLKQLINLDNPVTTQYFKITVKSGYDNGRGENVFFTTLAEVGLF